MIHTVPPAWTTAWIIWHTACLALCTTVLLLIDVGVISPIVRSHIKKDRDVRITRWFLIHATANLGCVIFGLNALRCTMTNPHDAADSRVYSDTTLFGNASQWPLTICNAVHLYHMIGGFHLSSGDYFHHCLFLPWLGIPGQVLLWGAVEPAGVCFISGMPGGTTYFLLGLCKLGILHPITEKRITANLNAWIRIPGILVHSFLVYQAILYGRHTLAAQSGMWAAWLHVVLPPYNALFYGKQSVANYTVHYMTQLLGQDPVVKERIVNLTHTNEATITSPTARAVHVSWKEAIQTPQRGC